MGEKCDNEGQKTILRGRGQKVLSHHLSKIEKYLISLFEGLFNAVSGVYWYVYQPDKSIGTVKFAWIVKESTENG